jgi:hypothetical protein
VSIRVSNTQEAVLHNRQHDLPFYTRIHCRNVSSPISNLTFSIPNLHVVFERTQTRI